jgi:hypothetical protein
MPTTEVATTTGRNTVNVGPQEWASASAMTVEFANPSVAVTVRQTITVATALNIAEKLGFRNELTAPDGRRYSYSVRRPKVLLELDNKGVPTGKTLDLISAGSHASAKQKKTYKTIKGGMAG